MERHIFYATMLCTVVDIVGVLQNYTATAVTTTFIVPHPIIRDQPREGGREKLMDEIGKKRKNKVYIKINRKNGRKERRKVNK